METVKPLEALEFSLDTAKMAAGRVGSSVPSEYRLCQKTDGSVVLQGLLRWHSVDHSEAGHDWVDIPMHKEEGVENVGAAERKVCMNCGTWPCDRSIAYSCGKESVNWSPRKLEAGEVKFQQDLHGAIMNLPCNVPGIVSAMATSAAEAYRIGHRDARHQAAELALKHEKK